MSVYTLRQVQRLAIPLDHAWEYFSSPHNLPEIIPSYLHFTILSDSGTGKMYAGEIIRYKVKPLFGIPVSWLTEITHVKDKEYFIDEQRFGPYALWHHTHFFKAIDAGVEMTDLVHYKLPLGIIGRWFHAAVVKNQLKEIFDYRRNILKWKFGELPI